MVTKLHSKSKQGRNAAWAALALVLASGCTLLQPKLPPNITVTPESARVQAPSAPTALDTASKPVIGEFDDADVNELGELRFQPGDAIKVAIWGHAELDHIAVVQPNGKITVPLVGEVPAADQTVAQLRERVSAGLLPYTRNSSPDLRPGDTLNFLVWHEDGLRHNAIVEPDGYATFPIVGRLKVVGRPLEAVRQEAQDIILKHVRDARVSLMPMYTNRRYLQDYAVSVLSDRLQPRRIAVVGEVGIQGLTELRSGMRVVEALAQAQVRLVSAKLNSIIVIRNPSGGGTPRYRLLRIQDFLDGLAPYENLALRNGDIVIVPKTTIAKVGDFVDQFFVRTLPAFSWWAGLWQASTARASADTVRLINESLERQLTNITITPNPGK